MSEILKMTDYMSDNWATPGEIIVARENNRHLTPPVATQTPEATPAQPAEATPTS